ncbi:MAG: hypothetical protein MJ234_04795 [bacterium]|nr:hypothetical protein [bacterium]
MDFYFADYEGDIDIKSLALDNDEEFEILFDDLTEEDKDKVIKYIIYLSMQDLRY